MFKLIWSAVIGGGPAEWAILGLGAMFALGGAFGAGYAVASGGAITRIATVASTAGPAAAKAQEKHDSTEHAAATAKSGEVKQADAAHDAKNLPIYQHIAAASIPTPDNPKKSCDVSVDVIKDLNEAGHY